MQEKRSPSDIQPSSQSTKGLNALLFCISDVRNGVGPLLSIHLKNVLQWDPAKIGIALATVEFSAFLCQIPSGLLADASKRKRLLVAFACCLIILGCSMILLFQQFSVILIAQLMMGIAIALISPAIGSITLGLFGRRKFPPRLATNEFWNHSGNVFSALAAGGLGYLFGTYWIFFLVICCAIGSLISLSFIKPQEIHYQIARELPEQAGSTPLPLSKLFRRTSIIIFNFSLILYYIANGAQLSLLGQVLATKDPSNFSLYIAGSMLIAELTMIGIAYLMSLIVNRFNRKTFFLTAFIILPIRALLYTWIENPYFLLTIQTLDGIAAGILGTIGGVINSDLAVDTGRFNFLQGMGAMSTNVGESISLLLSGFIAKSFGFNVSFFSLACVALFGILFFALLMPETKKA